ncbi:MAG: formate dehydrogenase accessory sulfurtransferase FdhD [Candidatus Eisenbacteria bacterium]|uniref:Sulfur carrier protein FdhD n=1 Tax=Eiseniibacteriota bacterium TaxID=2212470 RepID=A0A849SJQ1_UNCEI|nr:formate dehydrogenase accessory sulfurtransferase FdhD [Candidatus Eisenbacteria bacterium]
MGEPAPSAATLKRSIVRVSASGCSTLEDSVAVERPLSIRIEGRDLAVTLRTPGHDLELALGFLAGEGLITNRHQVRSSRETPSDCADAPDVIDLALAPEVRFDWTRLERHFSATAACGLCGRAHLDALRAGLAPLAMTSRFAVAPLLALPARLRERQLAFAQTGGLHAAVLCDEALEPRVVREDVGRHNAVDKVIGWRLDAEDRSELLWVSGRAGAEIVLKAARARLAVLAAVGAPSSLAIELAEAAGLTLIGFMRDARFNVYSGVGRIV